MRIGNKTEKRKKTLTNINKLFNERNDAMTFEAKRKAAEEESKPERTKAKTQKISV